MRLLCTKDATPSRFESATERWRWTQANAWRVPHLLVTIYLFLRAHFALPCLFSAWEDALRSAPIGVVEQVTTTQSALRFLFFRNLDPLHSAAP